MTGTDQENFLTAVYQAGPGIQFVVGRLKGQTTTTVQSVLFDKARWNVADARTWLGEHNFKAPEVDETENRLRFRQREPGEFEPGSLRTISAGQRENADDQLGMVQKFLADAGLDELADFLRGAGFEVITDQDVIEELLRSDHDNEPDDDYVTEGDDFTGFREVKVVGGVGFPASDWAYVPDATSPSTWKLRLTTTPGGKPDRGFVKAAVAAIGPGGFRGRRLQIPEADRSEVQEKLKAAYGIAFPRKRFPTGLEDGDIFADEDGDEQLFDLKNVEIFRAGKWNGDKYTVDDLKEMVRNFDKVGFRPPVKLGHREASGEPAYGWVQSIRVVGDRLVADFMDLPKQIYNAIKNRRFDHVSAEIFWNLKRAGRTFRRALKAVALLGTETPAVSDLKPLRDSIAGLSGAEFEGLHSYQLSMEDLMSEKDQEALKELEAKLAEQAEALKALQEENKELKAKGTNDDDTALALKQMQERQEQMQKELAESREREKQARIDSEVEKVKVPAYQDFFAALFELCAQPEVKTVKFKTEVDGDDGKKKTIEEDTDPTKVVIALRDKINRHAELLTGEYSIVNEADFEKGLKPRYSFNTSDAGQQVDDLVKAYCAKNKLDPEKDYGTALDIVLNDPENREVAQKYLAS